jgi:coproporphyrinogen III oxidase-like Fe-S oxidoreductase
MLWFEPLLLKILRHEYTAAMHFDAGPANVRQPLPPAEPCQLYVHVPFCEALCPFCSFHRVQFRENKAAGYFTALRGEIRAYHARGFRFSDVYVGGGTPTVAPAELLETLALIRSLWPIRTISVETNPNHLHEDMFTALRSVGVSRLSVGVQSFDDGLLRQMERFERYGSGEVMRERLAAARGKFQTLNVDMIFNLPNQTLEMLDRDLKTLSELRVDQVSFYPLMTAPAARRKMEKTMGREDPARRHDFYARILEALQSDYRASSAWCFTRKEERARDGAPGMIDEYIIDQENYVGVGSGAFSYVNGWMHSTTFSINQYRERLNEGLPAITRSKQLTLKERMRYDYLVRLFGLELPRDYLRRKFGRAFWLRMAPELLAMRLIGATRHDADAIRLTPLGMYCWVLMMAEFFNTVNVLREQMRLNIRAELDARARTADPLTLATAANGLHGS